MEEERLSRGRASILKARENKTKCIWIGISVWTKENSQMQGVHHMGYSERPTQPKWRKVN